LRDRRRVEGVRFDNVGACIQVFGVDAAYDVGAGQQQKVVVAFDVLPVRGETLSAVIGFLQRMALNHCPHRAVEKKDTLAQEGGKLVRTVWLHG
jgi:hypothetical protein